MTDDTSTEEARTEETRTVTQEIAIDAPVEAVWRALTDAEELKRWFPVDARVEPGEGGKIWISWGPGSEGESRIAVWEPNRHLRTAVEMEGMAVPFAVDYYLEARGGTTILRLVNSGFGASADWDDMYNGTDGGWRYFLFNLRHYLERHAGTPRALAWERRPSSRPRDELWRAIGTALALPEDVEPAPGAPLRLELSGQSLDGAVVLALPPGHLAAVIPGLDDGLLFLELEPGSAKFHLGAYLSTYGLPPARVEELRVGLGAFLDRLLPG